MNTSRSPSRILVVDDSEDSRDITAAILEDGGFTDVTFARSATEAFELLGMNKQSQGQEDSGFDLIIMDIRMPDIDGIEACARIRLHGTSRHLPILMLSGVREVQALNQAFVAGANDFVAKPVTQISLLARVRTLLRLRREQQRRQLREAELRQINENLQRSSLDSAVIDQLTRMASGIVVEVTLRNCRENRDPAALGLIQIEEFGMYVNRHGDKAGDKLVQMIAASVARAPAPLVTLPCYYGEGAFMLVQPGSEDTKALDQACRIISSTVEASAIPHGNSPSREEVSVLTVTGWAEGEALNTLSTRLLAEMERKQAEGVKYVPVS
ncbi:response regulator [Henriciella sp.]|uniref:response regulator n=1 Tax=Henriciella sp. TaxID=1968823 RepID=UPI002635CB53|nr:response regulator [Henriciella sp.]